MTDLTRSARPRRGGRRPGWVLLTVLLVLAIGASSALVFTNRVELLKLAVILALWAAVVAAFVSVIYRRQSDIDQAKVRDLKLVYDLQLDREISARREYELSVETQLRRELASELRAQAADEVAGLRAELAALRANLEILFDADLSHRPAIETDRTTVRAYSDWARDEMAGRVSSSRIDTEVHDDTDFRTDESPIIDVPAEPSPPEYEWAPPPSAGGAHRRPSDLDRERRRHLAEEPRAWSPPPPAPPPPTPTPPPQPPPQPEPAPQREAQFPWLAPKEPPKPPEPAPPRQEPAAHRPEPAAPRQESERVASSADWQPAPAEGQWIPAGTPGSNWTSPIAENGSSGEYVGKRRAPEPAMSSPPAEPRRGRHSAPADATDPGRPASPTLATEPAQPPPHSEPPPAAPTPATPRHRSADDTGGQSVAELLARLQATPAGGGRRRRREE
jgi:hypothetical protein